MNSTFPFILLMMPLSGIAACSHYARLDLITDELAVISPPFFSQNRETYRSILATSLSSDAYVCDPLPHEVFKGQAPTGWRTIRGQMPHYGFYFGPMHYSVYHADGHYWVSVRFAVEVSNELGDLELPDCALKDQLEGKVLCQGTGYSESDSLHACPDSGIFRASATPNNIRALLARWSRDAESYYNRDAQTFGLPITYDFSFTPIDPKQHADGPAHARIPLSPTCGRTPYFQQLRSGWSMPILAHEVGHMLGLLDEYEMFSGIFDFYPKTAFRGAEKSRFGLSMKENSLVLPLHHYLVLRRFFCPEPATHNPYTHALPISPG